MVDQKSDDKKTTRLEGFEFRKMVFCRLVKTYVEINFCKTSGPMASPTGCTYFREIRHDEKGNIFLTHAIPVEEKVLDTILKETP